MTINQAALHVLLARAQYDLAAAQSAALIVAGDRLGLYRALAAERMTSAALAAKTRTNVRYIESWLSNQTAGGYVTCIGDTYGLTPEQSLAMTGERSAFFLPAAFALSAALAATADALVAAMRGDSPEVPLAAYDAVDRMAIAKASAVVDALPPFDGAVNIVDVGAGSGALVSALRDRYPAARVLGVEPRGNAVKDVRELPSDSFDVVLCVETLHELPDPVAAAAAMHRVLRDGGRLFVVEQPRADDLTATARLFSATNVLFCLPASRGEGIGLLAGEEELRRVLRDAGFATITRIESRMFLILECR